MTNAESRFPKMGKRKFVLSSSRFGEIEAPAIDPGAAIRFVATLRDKRFPRSNSNEGIRSSELFVPYFSTNKALEPTSPSVTIRADARLAPAAAVAHL